MPGLIDLTPAERFAQEGALPPIFGDDGYSPARIVWYTRLTVDSGAVLGGATRIPEFIAGMIGEAGLNNRTIGDSNPDPPVGVGWCQLDTGHHVPSIDAFHWIRSDPLFSLIYVTDPSNGLCRQGGFATDFNKQRWHAWEDSTINPETGWNPLSAAVDAYEEVTNG